MEDLFNLHLAVQSEAAMDIMRPNGAWKREPNGSYGIRPDGQRIFIEYAHPRDVPELMKEWLEALNTSAGQGLESLLEQYARLHVGFTAVHPFWDGNGRMARLLSNLPLLKEGFPPLVIQNQDRQDYIAALNAYSLETGQPTAGTGVWPGGTGSYRAFAEFCQAEYGHTQKILEEAWAIQRERGSPTP
jgi:Fic family protein